VGVGDALGQFDRTNLLRVVRADGVIVKPDDSITPLDSAYIAQANNRGLPRPRRGTKDRSRRTFSLSGKRPNNAPQASCPRSWVTKVQRTPTTTSTSGECTSSRGRRLNLSFRTMVPTGSSFRSGRQAWVS